MELYELEYSHSTKTRQKEQAESDKAIAENKVERLKEAYKQVNTAYDNIKLLKSDVEKQTETGEEWKGDKAKAYAEYISDTFSSNYNTYINWLDEIQDSINDELTRQENKVLELSGDIFGLVQALNSLWNRIQNWGNDF